MVATKRKAKVKKTKLDKLADKNAKKGHARLSPSAADRWTTCTASVLLYDKIQPVDSSSEAADRGTRLHDVSYGVLKKDDPKFTKKTLKALPADEREAIQPYIEYVQSRPGLKVYESEVIFIDDNVFGTADTVILDFKRREIEVIDLKTGAGIPVAASHNKQLVCYGLGALRKYGDLCDWKRVKMTISQAAAGNPVDPWVQTIDEMIRWAEFIRDTANRIDNGDVVFSAEEKACRWCRVKTDCPELKRLGSKAATADFEDLAEVDNDDDDWDEEDRWGELYASVPVLEMYIKAIKDQTRARFNDGEKTTGFKLGKGRASWHWKNEKRAITALGKLKLAKNAMMTEPVFKTIAQIKVALKAKFKKLTGKEVDAMVEKLIVNTPTAPAIVHDDSSRETFNKQDEARDEFSGLTGGEEDRWQNSLLN